MKPAPGHSPIGHALCVLVLLLALALPATAEEVPPTAAPGLEIRLSGTVGILTNLADRYEDASAYSTSPLAGVDLEDVPSIGFNAEIGYRLHPRFSVAAHVEHLAEIAVSVENGARAGGAGQAGDGVLSGESWALTGDARAYVLTGALQPYAVLGAGWMWADTDDEPVVRTGTDPDPALRPIDSEIGSRQGFVARAGAGLDVHLNDAFFLNAQVTYVVPVGRIRDFDYVSVAWGLGYRF